MYSKSSLEIIDLNKISVIIPAAGVVPEGIRALSNIECSAMIPVAGRPIIFWTLTYLQSLGLKHFVISVARRKMFIEDFVKYSIHPDCDCSFVVPSRDGGLGFTVKELVDHVTGDAVLVVLGDTSFKFKDPSIISKQEPFILVSQVEESYRWCTAEVDSDNYLSFLHDKEPDLSPPVNALIGVYFFPDICLLKQYTSKAVVRAADEKRLVSMADIIQPFAQINPIRAYHAAEWFDCGNPDRLAITHRALLQKRDFNELSIDPVISTITKRSKHTEKFIDEINFIRLLPKELSILFPRIIDFSTEWDCPFLQMEYYGYPTLSDIFVFENVDPGIWKEIFSHLFEIITIKFQKYGHPLAHNTTYDMYIKKTQKRLKSMKASQELLDLVNYNSAITINGEPVANLTQMWDEIEELVKQMNVNHQGCVIHGDLCFSNILYDLRQRICKFIDPRGSFGSAGIYGDLRYDIAKLYHSVHGLYDFITNDLFHISVSNANVQLDIYSPERHKLIESQFENVFFSHFNHNEILLLTGLLFASMPALHYDKPKRQIAMYVRSLQLFDELFNGRKKIIRR